MGGLEMSTPETCGRRRTEGMQEALGRYRDAAGPEAEGMMPTVEDALGQKEDGGLDLERMDPQGQVAHQSNVRNGRNGGIRDPRLMRTKRSGWSACQTPGDTRGVWRESGEHQGPEQGPGYKGCPSAPEGTGCGCGELGSTGAAIQPLWPRLQRLRGGRAHGGDPTAAKPGCRVDQQAMCAAFREDPTE